MFSTTVFYLMQLFASMIPGGIFSDLHSVEFPGNMDINVVNETYIDTSESAVPTTAPKSETSALPAFPGAMGFGRFSSGGRGGRVVIVDTLEDSVNATDGKVSLREALEIFRGPRIVVFEVGGLFDTGITEILISGVEAGNLTLACQTAPKPGVIIKGAGIRITGGAQNIIMRHCTIRNIDPGMDKSEVSRSIGVIGTNRSANNMIFDHMSLSWATDENFTIFLGEKAARHSTNFTLSNSIIAEGDSSSSHSESINSKGRFMHSMGPSCNSNSATARVENCSIVANLIMHNSRRNPLIVGSSAEVQNNVIYNWHEIGAHAWPYKNEVDLYIAGNEFKRGPTTKRSSSSLDISGAPSVTRYKVTNNYEVSRFNWFFKPKFIDKTDNYSIGISPNPISEVNLDCVGASRPERDVIDTRLINEYLTRTGRVGIGKTGKRDYSHYYSSKHKSTYDKDRDGLHDQWEINNNLDPKNPFDYQYDNDKNGYTNLEEFINELSECDSGPLSIERSEINSSFLDRLKN